MIQINNVTLGSKVTLCYKYYYSWGILGADTNIHLKLSMGGISEPKSILLPCDGGWGCNLPLPTWNPSRTSCPTPFSALPCTTLRTLDSLLQELFFLGNGLACSLLGKDHPKPWLGFCQAVNHRRPPPSRLLCGLIFLSPLKCPDSIHKAVCLCPCWHPLP